MKRIIIHIVFIILIFHLSNQLSAQENTKPRIKVYKAWVKLKNNSDQVLKGLLYEIKDSSITIITSTFPDNYFVLKTDTIGINYKEINIIKTRRIRNIRRGLLIGSTTGYFGGVVLSYSLLSGEELAGLMAFEIGFGYAFLGAGVGAVVGTIKDRIPVKGNLENFNLYRSVLQDYSIIQESQKSNFVFEHKGFIDIAFGPTFAIGYLNNLSTGMRENVKPGLYGNFTVGYRFTRRFGISISQIDNEYSIEKGPNTLNWGLGSIMIGPIFSKPIGKKAYFDLNPSIGYSTMNFYIWDSYGNTTYEKEAVGVGINLNTSLTYYISNQWGLSAKATYLYTHQNFSHNQQESYKSCNICLGVVYRFSRKSL
jgi:hypothetical protein